MIPWILFGVIFTFAALEYLSLRLGKYSAHASVEVDLPLCAPGEEITLRYTISNRSSFPLLFVGFSLYLDDGAEICESEDWMREHVVHDLAGLRVDRRLRLMPHCKCTDRVRFRLSQRGLYSVGRLYLEIGDYLGLHSIVRSIECGGRIICTAPLSEDCPALKPVGGILGEQSVLRFIHEDPCLLSGYREYSGREPMRQISWTQSAKLGQWMVKQMDHTAEASVVVLLNMYGGGTESLERCLALVRTVCELLEERKIPYAFRSNGDVRDVTKGLGRGHVFPILRGIGLSRLVSYTGFGDLVDRCVAERERDHSFIVITPAAQDALLRRLQAASDHRVVVLGAEGGGES
ncbi:MAG: DUF58 domain-containing protein [Oscillospiraceae bacterium]|nr:DUF58 domain-containing protein [Oscillospiraceae bacterium]